MKGSQGTTHKHAGGTKHAGSHKHRPTAAQQAALKKMQAAHHHHHHHQHAVGKHATHPKPAKWSPTAEVACCAIEALAASLRLTGHPVTDEDVLALYWRLTDDPDAGVRIEQAIDAAAAFGLAGARLTGAHPASRLTDGVLLGIDLTQRHALTVEGHGVWTWGAWRPASCSLLAAADEAWSLEWTAA